MDFKTFEIDGQQYTLDNPVDLLLNWALEAATDEFKSKESLDRVATVIKAVCPTIPERYFFPLNNLTIPLLDSYQIMDFTCKLLVCVTERRLKAIEGISPEDRKILGNENKIDEKIKKFRLAIETMRNDFTKMKFNLILGGVQIDTVDEDVSIANISNSDGKSIYPLVVLPEDDEKTQPRIKALKQQLEVLNNEISNLEITSL